MTKTVSTDYEREEKRAKRKPAEVFDIWKDGGPYWRYTNSDTGILYNGNKYVPGVISRGTVQYNGQLDVSSMSITANYVVRPVVEFIANSPLDVVWVQAARVFRRYPATASGVIFIGLISAASFQGQKGRISCVGMEYFLKQEVPRYRYHPPCNNKLFDEKCGLARNNFGAVNAWIDSVSADGLTVTFDIGGLWALPENYFTLGYIDAGVSHHMITSHTKGGANLVYLSLRYPAMNLSAGDIVDVYAGCDLKAETCRDKFDNLDNFFGFLYVPVENPVMRT